MKKNEKMKKNELDLRNDIVINNERFLFFFFSLNFFISIDFVFETSIFSINKYFFFLFCQIQSIFPNYFLLHDSLEVILYFS